jgi:hypothetical protein
MTMIWLTWRQHRMQLLAGTLVLTLVGLPLLLSRPGIAAAFHSSGLADCLAVPGRDCGPMLYPFTNRYSNLQFLIPLFLVLPALVGVFWGAPLVARELEQGTHQLAWTQGVSRLRWTATKAGALAAVTVLGAGLITGLLSWWSRPFVTASDNRFALGVFGLRGIVPVGYALFALAAGVAAGAVIRRTVPAMAATVAVYAAVRAVVEVWLRPHFARPRTLSYPFFGESPRSGLGDWVLSTRTMDASGHLLANGDSLNLELLAPRCPGLLPANHALPPPDVVQSCIQRLGLHVQATYQPGDRYWQFQAVETAIFVSLALMLLGFSIRWIRRLD